MMLRIGNRPGFTLVEVMVATAILSFGVTMLYNAFFICIDSVTYASNRLNAGMWAQNKIWEERDALLRSNMTSGTGTLGTESFNYRNFDWQGSVQPVDDALMALTLTLSWKEAAKHRTFVYSTYQAL